MYSLIQIKRKSKNNSYKITESWKFTIIDETLFLDGYTKEKKPIKKDENSDLLKSKSIYDRLFTQNSNITEEETPLPEDVKEEALNEYIKKLSVKKWSEKY